MQASPGGDVCLVGIPQEGPEGIWFLGSMKIDPCSGPAGSDLGEDCMLCFGGPRLALSLNMNLFSHYLGQGHLSSRSAFLHALASFPNSSMYLQINVFRPPSLAAKRNTGALEGWWCNPLWFLWNPGVWIMKSHGWDALFP